MRKIFISSTFRDMQAERDAIHTIVVPQLRAMAQRYGEDVEVCDLRWGVNTGDLDSEAGSSKVLSVCLDEIDKCKPFMLVMLGERYGWIPEPKLLEDAARRKNYQLEELEKSVTALEIEYGALNDSDVLRRSVFLFRDPIPQAGEEYQSEGEEYAARLNALKARIRKLAKERVFEYSIDWDEEKKIPTNLENFTEIVTKQLHSLLEQEWIENANLSENKKEEKRHWGFVDAKAGQFGGRGELLKQCKTKLAEESGTLTIVGGAGSGKSTLWCRLAADYRIEGWNVFPFVCGNTGQSVSAMNMLQQWIYYVEELLEIEHFEKEDQDGDENTEKNIGMKQKTEDDWKERFRGVLSMYCTKDHLPPLLLAADGLDQLNHDELSESFGFLPVFKQEKVYFLLSCLEDYNRKQYKGDIITVNPMAQQEKVEVLSGMLSYQRKGLDQAVTDEVIKKEGADNPLYLSLLVQRLAMMDRDDFAVIAEYGNDMEAINRYQKELIQKAPEDAETMSCILIRETAERVNQELVQKAAEYIAVSRHGLREIDLQALLENEGVQWNSLDFSRAVHYMPMMFVERENGQIDLTHRLIRSALRRSVDEKQMNRNIWEYLKTLPDEDALRMNEIVYYCYVLDEKEELADYIGGEWKNKAAMKKVAQELYWICMEDSGDWFEDILKEENVIKYVRDMSMTLFVFREFTDAFIVNSMMELEVKLKINICILNILRTLKQDKQSSWGYDMCCFFIGEIYRQQGKWDAAQKMQEEALDIRRELYEEQKSSSNAIDYCISCLMLGAIYEQQGKLESALEKYKELYEISKKFYYIENEKGFGNLYCHSCEQFVYDYMRQGELQLARKMQEEVLEIRQKLYEEEQTVESSVGYSQSYSTMARIYNALGNLELSQKNYEEGYKIARLLYEKKGIPESASIYGVSCANLGDIYEDQGKLDKALAKYEEGMDILRIVYEEQNTPGSAYQYSTSCERLGDIYQKQGKLVEAQVKYRESARIRRDLYDKEGTPRRVREYFNICERLVEIYNEQGEQEKVVEVYEEELEIYHTSYEYDASQNGKDYRYICKKLGDIYAGQENLDRAIEVYEVGFKVSEMLCLLEQEFAHIWWNITIGEKLGELYERQEKPEKAQEKYEKGIEIGKLGYLMERTSESAFAYSNCYRKLACFYESQGKSEEAQATLEEALEVCRGLYYKFKMMKDASNYRWICLKLEEIYKKQGKSKEAIEVYSERINAERKQKGELPLSVFDNEKLDLDKHKYRNIPNFFFPTNLKEKQLKNILKYCAKGIQKDEITAFCGTQVFKCSGKKGFVFTKMGLYADDSIYKYNSGPKVQLPILYEEISGCSTPQEHPEHIQINFKNGDVKFIYADIFSGYICEVLNKIASMYEN